MVGLSTRMAPIDLNLLAALDVLLAERSVTRAARRLGLSVSATSRTLTRLRSATGDPLLVQAGRSLVPTPYAERLAGRVHALAQEARDVLTPATDSMDPALLERTFTIRANEGFVALFAAALVTALTEAAPHVRLRFAPKPDKDVTPLRDGRIDLEIGTAGGSAPEVRSQLIFRDRFVGAARLRHALFERPVTPELYAACGHVVTSRRGASGGPVDDALGAIGLRREIVVIVPSFLDALNIARQSDLVALVPQSCLRHGEMAAQGIRGFDLPVTTPELAICAMWHPRFDADPAHRWFRQTIVATCRAAAQG
ncbi:LysR family transcriptional regulator [Sphingomonas sp. ZT3P38]|uniref:LysR family transcriptional regulator n=1 Tax=Parasphingomonas zepuensis TaxID=3096161 RepID=UPI002FC5C423